MATACKESTFLGIPTSENILCDGECIEKNNYDPSTCSVCKACKECQTCELKKIKYASGGLIQTTYNYYVPHCATATGYHIYNDECEEDSDQNCGLERVNCTSSGLTCQDGKCQ